MAKTRDEVLTWLGSVPKLPGEIARNMGRKTGAVSRCLASLESDGLCAGSLMLARQDFGAGTATYSRAYKLTEKGRARVNEIEAAE